MKTETPGTETSKIVSSTRLFDAAVELLAVAKRRSDDDLPHPSEDNRLWTARMQDAWVELECAIIAEGGETILEEISNGLISAERFIKQ